MSLQIKQGWEELLAARESVGFSSADVELKTDSVASAELSNDAKKLVGEMKSTKRVLNRILRNESYQSTMNSIQFLDDVESTLSLSNMNHILEVMELVQSDQSQPGWIPKEEKLRRHRITSEKYFARLLVNGSVVGDTKVEKLDWPSFSVKLSHRFNCKMSQKPADTCIQIWKSSIGFVPDTLICTCFVNSIEDEATVSDQSNDDSDQVSPRPTVGIWLQFSSNGSDLQRCVKGTVWISSSWKVRKKRSSPATRMAKIPRQDLTIFHQSKRLIRPPFGDFETRDVKKTEVKNQFCPDRQSMMAFKLPTTDILFSNKSLLEEPLRHVLIKKRQSNLSVPSPIPITERDVQNSDIYHDLIRNKDDESSDEVSKS